MKDIRLKFIHNGSRPICGSCQLHYSECSNRCRDAGHFEFKTEEPKEIQTESEYEWVEKRVEYLLKHKTIGSPIEAEAIKHIDWMQKNKLEKWEVCTKENTKVGDEVSAEHNNDVGVYVVKYMCNNSKRFLLANKKDGADFTNFNSLSGFLIDINTYQDKEGDE